MTAAEPTPHVHEFCLTSCNGPCAKSPTHIAGLGHFCYRCWGCGERVTETTPKPEAKFCPTCGLAVDLDQRLAAALDRNREYAGAIAAWARLNEVPYFERSDNQFLVAQKLLYALAANPPDGVSAGARVAELEAEVAALKQDKAMLDFETLSASHGMLGRRVTELDAELAKAREEIGALRGALERIDREGPPPPSSKPWRPFQAGEAAMGDIARQALATLQEHVHEWGDVANGKDARYCWGCQTVEGVSELLPQTVEQWQKMYNDAAIQNGKLRVLLDELRFDIQKTFPDLAESDWPEPIRKLLYVGY